MDETRSIPKNFSWLIENKLAGSGLPNTEAEMKWILNQKIKSVITLTEQPLPESFTHQVDYLHAPAEDFSPSDLKKIDYVVDFIHQNITNGKSIMVHCAGGRGRTGTILACYLVKYQNYSANDAIEKVRGERPDSIQSTSQEAAIEHYEKFVAKK